MSFFLKIRLNMKTDGKARNFRNNKGIKKADSAKTAKIGLKAKRRTLSSTTLKVRPRTCSVDARKRRVKDVETILPGTKQSTEQGKQKTKQKYILNWSVFSVFAITRCKEPSGQHR